MDFFNSLSQVAKNKGNFKKWEENQKDEQARREELYKRRQYSDTEIAKAKALGENIIDVVDIMDNHSESVAENVETATEPIVAFAPFASMLGSGYLMAKLVHNPNNKKIHEFREQLKNDPKAQELCNKILEFNKSNGRNLRFSEWELTYKRSIKSIKNSELRAEAMKYYNKFQKDTAKFRKAQKYGWIGAIGLTIASFIGANIYAAKLQVDSSKIARYQARESLKDPKAFVAYTPEQIAKAKEEIAKHPELLKEKKKEKLKTGMFKSIINVLKDRKAYKQSIKNDTDESKIVTRELTPEELKRAKQDQEVIQRTVRLINNEAEKYSQNMEVAAEVLVNGTPFLGAAVGGALGWILNKTGVITKFVDKNVAKNGSEKTKELYADLKKGGESGATYSFKWNKFRNSFMKDLQGPRENVPTTAKHKSKDIIKTVKRFFTTGLAHQKGRGWIIAGIGSIATGIAGMMIGLKLTKSASRAGRYTAKRELEKDPRNFIGYTEDDYNEVKDVKNNKKGISKLKEIVMFLPTVIKQYYAYEKYRKHEYKEKQVLNEQLHKQEVTDEQLREAKNLQRKLFNTFEKVDDNSQTYSESMEAAIDIAQPFVVYGGILTAASPFIWAGVQMKRGKLSAAKVLNKVTTFFSKSSEKMKSKWFKKYLKNVADNVSTTVQKTNVESKPVGTFLKGVDLKNDSIATILSKAFKNFRGTTADFRKLSDREQIKLLCDMGWDLQENIRIANPKRATQINNLITSLIHAGDSPAARADVLDIILNPASIKTMGKERYEKAYNGLKGIIQGLKTRDIYDSTKYTKAIEDLYKDIQAHIGAIPTDKLRGALAQIDNAPEIAQVVNKAELEKLIQKIENIQAGAERLDIEQAIDTVFTHKNVVSAVESAQKIKAQLETVKKNPIAQGLIQQLKQIEIIPEISPELAKICRDANVGIEVQASKAVTVGDVLGTKISDLLPSHTKSPKTALSTFKAKINNMTDDEFAAFAERIHFDSMDKKTMLEILPKLEKMLNNIPKEEMTAIWNKVVEEFNAHPDEFIKLVRSGKLGSIFMTPGLKKALKIAGISFTTFTLAMTYVIESWLADIKLKAGRLGVMKAMEGLNDPRYYADIEPAQKQEQSSNLMAKITPKTPELK